ncbi:M23 family metallopeptidase [Candidatus Dependentiae bacterium]|nr:M23 family metallopeptidase [Candidatus Dependentiae bacterium]
MNFNSLKKTLLLIFLICIFFLGACKPEPVLTSKKKTILPLKKTPGITSSFGEFRMNSFHMGIDFSTNKKIGKPVLAVNDGYIWRIRQNRNGYGKVIYIKHPDGSKTVYAHLSRFSNSKKLNLELRMERRIVNLGRKYGHQVTFSPTEFVVIQGSVIGYSGESGAGGPHLHFELRDKNNIPILPIDQIQKIPDEKIPIFTRLIIFPVSRVSEVEGLNSPIRFRINKGLGTEYSIEPFEVFIKGKVKFVLGIFDQAELDNKLGIRKVQVFAEKELVYDIDFNRIEYSHYRMGGLIYYNSQSRMSEGLYKLYKTNEYSIKSIERNSPESGIIECKNNEKKRITIRAFDLNNNTSVLTFTLVGYDEQVELSKDIIKSNFKTKMLLKNSEIFYNNSGRLVEFIFLNKYKKMKYYFEVFEKGKKKPVLRKKIDLDKKELKKFTIAMPKLGLGEFQVKLYSIIKVKIKKGKKYIYKDKRKYHFDRKYIVLSPDNLECSYFKIDNYMETKLSDEKVLVEILDIPSGAVPRGCVQKSKVFKFGPDDLPFINSFSISIKAPTGDKSYEQLGLYALRNGRYRFIGNGTLNPPYIPGRFSYLTEFLILQDIHHPAIQEEVYYDTENKRLVLKVKDNASGIDYSNIKIKYDGKLSQHDWDPDKNEIYIELKKKTPTGKHTFYAEIPDHSTNKLVYQRQLNF